MQALEQKPQILENSKNKVHYETGVYMGMGSFNVVSIQLENVLYF